jgi:hypothetical protein
VATGAPKEAEGALEVSGVGDALATALDAGALLDAGAPTTGSDPAPGAVVADAAGFADAVVMTGAPLALLGICADIFGVSFGTMSSRVGGLLNGSSP